MLSKRIPVFLQAFLLSRLVVWVAGAVALADIGKTKDFSPPVLVHGKVFTIDADTFFATAARWDAQWFLGIADHGYSQQYSEAFFPFYPFAVRLLSLLVGSTAVAAFLLVLSSFLLSLWLLYGLVEREFDQSVATRTTWLFAFFPGSLFFSAFYSESLLLLFSLLAFSAARSQRFALAGFAGACAALTRNVGGLLFIPLLLMYLSWQPVQKNGLTASGYQFLCWSDLIRRATWVTWKTRIDRRVLWLFACPLSLFLYPLGLALAGKQWNAPVIAQQKWKRSWELPFETIWSAGHSFVRATEGFADGSLITSNSFAFALADYESSFLLIAVILLCFTARSFLSLPYQMYCFACLAIPLFTPSSVAPLMSLPRFVAVLFPLAMMLALWTKSKSKWVYVLLLVIFCFGLVGYAMRFATWRWVA